VKARVDVLTSLEAQSASSSAFSIKSRQEINLEKQHQKELKRLRSQLGKMVSQDAWIKEMGLDKHQIKQIRETQLSGPGKLRREGGKEGGGRMEGGKEERGKRERREERISSFSPPKLCRRFFFFWIQD
jgi:hypothetical protein